MLTIKEILGNQYSDFMKYCTESEKKYPVDIFPSDYVAFRVQYGVSRDYINEIKNKLNNGGASEDNKVSSVDEVHEIVIVKQTKNLQDVVSEEDLEIATANLTETDIEEVNEDYGGDVDLTDISSAEDDANYDIVKKENNKIIPYDLHTPLYILFGVDNPEKYSNIIIAALDLKPSIEHIIKEEYREYVIDVLRCSIAQLFDFNNVPKTLIQKALKQIQSFLSIEIDSVEIREALKEPVNMIIEEIKTTLGHTPPELAADIVERGIVMTGGGSMLKGLSKLISKETNVPVILAERPLECVALGAGEAFELFKDMSSDRAIYDNLNG